MVSEARVFISHSTRDPRDRELALKINRHLQACQVDTWIAPNDIAAGEAWEPTVVSALEDCTHFLVLVSGAAVADGSWVLREIALARVRLERDPKFKVIPIFVGETPDFPGRGFLNGVQGVRFSTDEATLLGELEAAIPASESSADPGRAIVHRLTADFVGRENVFAALNEFMNLHRHGYFVLEGEPGAGKSAILAECVRRTGCVAHFNVETLSIDTSELFLENLRRQLARRFGFRTERAPHDRRAQAAFLFRLVEQTRKSMAVGEKLLIVVDALDEVREPDQASGNVLGLPAALPDGIYFFVSRRPGTAPIEAAVSRHFDLRDYPHETWTDVERFIARRLRAAGESRVVAPRTLDSARLMRALAEKSRGNFMYVHHVLNDLALGHFDTHDPDNLPEGLKGYYERHWRRMGMMGDPLPRHKLDLIYALCEFRSPVSVAVLARARAIEPVEVAAVVQEWRQFLHTHVVKDTTRYSLYHASFREFLHRRDIVQAAQLSIPAVNRWISELLWPRRFRG